MWNYFAGYVIIQIDGLSLERVINRMVAQKLDIWDLHKTDAHSIRVCIGLSDFYALRKVMRRTGCKLRIVKKVGIGVSLSFLIRRLAFVAGVAIICVLLSVSSRYIWFIDVKGLDAVSKETVIASINSIGITAGTPKKEVLPKKIATAVASGDARISWAGASIKGVILTVDVLESDSSTDVLKKGEPCSIYAAKDGVVTEVVAYSGQPAVTAGRAVKKGDLLVDGNLSTPERTGPFVEARAKVTAQVLYEFYAYSGPELVMESETGKYTEYTDVSLFGWTPFKQNCAYETYRSTELYNKVLRNCFLPLNVMRIRCSQTMQTAVQAPAEQLIDAAVSLCGEMMQRGIPNTARMLSKDTRTFMLDDGRACAVITVITHEDIASPGAMRDKSYTED